MSKSEELTSSDVAEYRFDEETFRLLEARSAAMGILPENFPVLDWGSGRGRAVAWLRSRGFTAYGVDVDPIPLKNAQAYFTGSGLDFEAVLRLIDADGGTGFPDDFFLFTFSDQVLEHVVDLSKVAAELYRTMAAGSIGLHTFPARMRFIEPHLFMPCVHWLPKNRIREAYILFCLALGVDPGWKGLRGNSLRARARAYYDYSVKKTHYRRPREIRRIFESAGFAVEFVAAHHRARLGRGLFRIPALRKAAIWLLNRAFTTQILIRK